MTIQELKINTQAFLPALYIENIFSYEARRIAKLSLDILLIIGAFLILLLNSFYVSPLAGVPRYEALVILAKYSHLIYGTLALLLAMRIFIGMLEAFHYFYYFKGVPFSLKERTLAEEDVLTYEAAEFVAQAQKTDLILHLFEYSYGRWLLMRLGLTAEDIALFLKNKKESVFLEDLVFPDEKHISFRSIALAVYHTDQEFSAFLFRHGISEGDYDAVLRWQERMLLTDKKKHRWWSRENLGKVPGIGKAWAYGATYTLEKYATPFAGDGIIEESENVVPEADDLERVLARSRQANALLVAEDESAALNVLRRFAERIYNGTVSLQLESKRMMLLNIDILTALKSDKAAMERELITILQESAAAGNILLVIDDLPYLVTTMQQTGINILELLEPYLSSTALQIVAVSASDLFHDVLEPHQKSIQAFEKITVHTEHYLAKFAPFEDEAMRLEGHYRIFFTYPAIAAAVGAAEKYFGNAFVADKVFDILNEAAVQASTQTDAQIDKSDVLRLVESKTGIPLGEVKAEEKNKLLNLEEILHKRIVGQNEAVRLIAGAMRRSRAGLSNPNRPLGSFLFLGPTGVGKTEMTKALAEAFFDNAGSIMRLDMSEFSAPDALTRLIGSYEQGISGVLSSMLREKQYGVLLLDEFEKSAQEVRDLFLQILDEGVFSDMSGKKVNARNIIIIATSNAGSDLIWDAVKAGEDLINNKDKIVNSIIHAGVFRPELLNRFDEIIMFHPLREQELREVAKRMLSALEARLARQGMKLVINDTLINFLVLHGSDPKFGARPIARAIQEHVEALIASKIIEGALTAGAVIELTEADMQTAVK